MPWTTETKRKTINNMKAKKAKKELGMQGYELLEDNGTYQAIIVQEGYPFPKTGYFTYRDGASITKLKALGIRGILKKYVSDDPLPWPEYITRQCSGTAGEDFIGVTAEPFFPRTNKWGDIYP